MRRKPAESKRQRGSVLTWIIAILALVVIVVGVGVWYVRANPLALYEAGTRRALAGSGFELENLETSVGQLAYWEGGTGPTLVLLHGAGDQAGAWSGIVDTFTDEYRIVIPDLPGHGASEPATGPLPMTTVYAGLEALLAAVGSEEPPVLVGNSMGAWLATLYAHRHPELVERVVAVNGGPLRGERTDLSLTPVDREAARTLMAALRDPGSPAVPNFVLDDIVERSVNGPIGRLVAEWGDLEAHLLDDRLGEISVPVDLIWGESDQLMSLGYAERMAAELPRSRLTTIPKCGHVPANECPEKLADALAQVLALEPPAAEEVGDPLEVAEEVEEVEE